MKSGFVFGFGAFISWPVYWEMLFIVRNGHIGSILPRLSAFAVMFVLGWIFYTLGTAVFKRTVTLFVAFGLGVMATLIQAAFSARFISRTHLVFNHEVILNASWSDKLGALAQLILPFLVCAFFAPLLGRRKANYSLKRTAAGRLR